MVTQTPYERNKKIRAMMLSISRTLMFDQFESLDCVNSAKIQEIEIEFEGKVYNTFTPHRVKNHRVNDVSISRTDSKVLVSLTLDGNEYNVEFDERLMLKNANVSGWNLGKADGTS